MTWQLFTAEELVLEDGTLKPTSRLVGLNDIGALARLCHACGRRLVVHSFEDPSPPTTTTIHTPQKNNDGHPHHTH